MKKETCTLGYHKNCIVLDSGAMKLVIATEVGPRIVGCFIGNSKENMFVVLPNEDMPEPANGYRLYGGHRLWHSPEDCPLSYEPDNDPVTVKRTKNEVTISGKADPQTGMKKTIMIAPMKNGFFSITHILENCGIWPVEIAPWALTMMAPGGMAILPQDRCPDRFPYAPDRSLKIWPYASLADHRLTFTENYILLANDPKAKDACKIGLNDMTGWIAYARKGQALVKYFLCDEEAMYPDGGCSVECYTCNRFTEIETLGGLRVVAPGETATHMEIWQPLDHLGKIATEKDVEKKVEPWLLDLQHDDDCCCDDCGK